VSPCCEDQVAVWDQVKDRLSRASSKPIGDLAMERCDEYRKKLEALSHLEMAIPVTERHGSSQWAMSLRDNWTRFVSVGNIFSGLFIPINEKLPKNPLLVRRPSSGVPYATLKAGTYTRPLLSST